MRSLWSSRAPSRAGARQLVALLAAGVCLAVTPLAFSMFDRSALGAQMLDEFKPFMTDARLAGFQRHIRDIDAGVREPTVRSPARSRGPAPPRTGASTRA